MIKFSLKESIENILESLCSEGSLGQLKNVETPVVIERPRNIEHGDFACGIALKLAGKAKMAPMKIAEILANKLMPVLKESASVEIAAPGYLNFKLRQEILEKTIQSIHVEGNNFGRSKIGQGKRVLIEYVSANPTGDLHIGHGRNAVFGSSLANLMKFCDYEIEQEFFINDAGVQITKLGQASWSLYKILLLKADEKTYPEDAYPRELLEHFIKSIVEAHGEKFLELSDDEGADKLAYLCKDEIIYSQKELLKSLGIEFDRWFSEKPLHTSGEVDRVLEQLRLSSLVYEKEGALWLKAEELGDIRDRVLVKSDGNKTYLAADAAYHLNKYKRGFDLMINIWGADHHGQIAGLKASLSALGEDPNKLEVILTQIVNLAQDGQTVRMSKRMGTVVFLADLVSEVGADSVRYYLAESSPLNPISFDLELAKRASKENPAFYIQYAHARCCAILRKVLESSSSDEKSEEKGFVINADDWKSWQKIYKENSNVFAAAFANDSDSFIHQKNLVLQLSSFQEVVEEALLSRQPGKIARYAYDLANDLQKFYEVSRVITDKVEVTKARLGLIIATKQVLANALSIIGVRALERM